MVYLDSFSISFLAVSLVLFVSMVLLITRTSKANRANIRNLERQLRRVSKQNPIPSEEARHLCCAIRRIHPNAQAGLDYQLGDDGDGPYIREWLMPVPQPGHDVIAKALDEHHKERAVSAYRQERAAAYPSITDQLDALFKARHGNTTQLEELDAMIRDIKCRYPKPGDCERDCHEN